MSINRTKLVKTIHNSKFLGRYRRFVAIFYPICTINPQVTVAK